MLALTVSLLLLAGCGGDPADTSAPQGSTAPTVQAEQTPTSVSVGEQVEFHGKKWEVTFADEFDGTRIDSTKWTYAPNYLRGDFGNNYWNRKQVSVENGELRLGIDYDAETDRILSGAILTDHIFEQAYGYYECRAKLQAATGCWSAFWLMCGGETAVGNGGVDGAEIDIVESPWFMNGNIQSAIHWDGYDTAHQSVCSPQYYLPNMYYDYHTFALEWTKDAYIFYVDGVETWRTDAGGICSVPCHMILSVEAGSWGGQFIAEQMPACFTVDYVHVYKECE